MDKDVDDLDEVFASLQAKYAERIKSMQEEETSANLALAQSDDILRERIREVIMDLLIRDKSVRHEIERHTNRHVDEHMREFRHRLQNVFN